jgi:hypothetical protein
MGKITTFEEGLTFFIPGFEGAECRFWPADSIPKCTGMLPQGKKIVAGLSLVVKASEL